MLIGNVAIQATVPTNVTTPKPSRIKRSRRDGSFMLVDGR